MNKKQAEVSFENNLCVDIRLRCRSQPSGYVAERLLRSQRLCVPASNRSGGRGFESHRGLIFHTKLLVQFVNQIWNKNIFQGSFSDLDNYLRLSMTDSVR